MTGGGAPPGGAPPGGASFSLPPALAAAIALVVAGLAAVGVTGDALTRAVRNQPKPLAWALTIALAATALVAAALLSGWMGRVGVVVLAAAAVWAVWLGAFSVAEREQPLVALSSTSESTGVRTLTVEVSAAGLPTNEQVLVQVVGIKKFDQVDKATVVLCEHSWAFSFLDPGHFHALPASSGTLLLWNRIGPDRTGTVKATIKIPIPSAKYQGICAWAPLPRKTPTDRDIRNSAAYLKFDSADAAPKPAGSRRTSKR
jgi:hypothetical protein